MILILSHWFSSSTKRWYYSQKKKIQIVWVLFVKSILRMHYCRSRKGLRQRWLRHDKGIYCQLISVTLCLRFALQLDLCLPFVNVRDCDVIIVSAGLLSTDDCLCFAESEGQPFVLAKGQAVVETNASASGLLLRLLGAPYSSSAIVSKISDRASTLERDFENTHCWRWQKEDIKRCGIVQYKQKQIAIKFNKQK